MSAHIGTGMAVEESQPPNDEAHTTSASEAPQPAQARTASSGGMANSLIAVGLLLPLLIYFSTAASIVAIWNRSETFAHGYIIVPISLWLVWRRRATLAAMTPAPWWPALLLLAACGFAWLAAELGDVQIVRQYAFVAMFPIAALALMGPEMAGMLVFPLAFLLFAVPFGEIFIDPLIGVTANFAVEAVRATGIPVLREGTHFMLPSGNWAVVEACSGVRYLISSVTLGCLYAYLTYRSFLRRALFVAMSVVVPIIANGLRAYMIVMIGHLSGMTLAVGVDHIIYGWLFFGLVMFLMFWIGSFWREDEAAPSDTPIPMQPSTQIKPAHMVAAVFGVAIAIGIWPAYALYLDHADATSVPVSLTGIAPSAPATAAFVDWKPAYAPADAELQRYYDQDGRHVGLALLYYRNQHRGTELISSTNLLVRGKDAAWNRLDNNVHKEVVGQRMLPVREETLVGVGGKLLVWHWYWIDGRFTNNDYLGKLLQVKQKFFSGSDDGAAVMVFAPFDDKPEEARTAMRSFLERNLSGVEAALAQNRK